LPLLLSLILTFGIEFDFTCECAHLSDSRRRSDVIEELKLGRGSFSVDADAGCTVVVLDLKPAEDAADSDDMAMIARERSIPTFQYAYFNPWEKRKE
jgi:hypothetical protein